MPLTRPSRIASAPLERVIRPFLPNAARPDRKRVYFEGGTQTNGRVQDTEGEGVPSLEWEAAMDPQTLTMEGVGFSIDLGKQDTDARELERSTHTVRVYSSENPADYVEVEVTDWIRFRDQFKRRQTLRMNNG